MTPANLLPKARRLAKMAEGFEPKPYLCPAGHLTIGYGHNLEAAPLKIKLTRPIEEGITEAQASEQLDIDLTVAWDELVKNLPWVKKLDEVYQAVFLDMSFNMGWTVFRQFKATQRCAKDGFYPQCAEQMKRSAWYRQVGSRGRRLVKMMLTGLWPWPDEQKKIT